jgi:ATP-dependent RNA helicase RhlE
VSFTELGLAHEIARAVREKGYEAPTPIQKGTIPGVIAGRDLIGCAQTGTGKTAAFTLPILHRLRAGARGRVRALILTPTRELALQVGESLRIYGRHVRLASAVIHGGVSYQPQETALRRGVDVLVATPGRLLDHMERGKIDFRGLEVLVLDEADRMLDMGFIRDVRRIIRALPARRQTLFFSATMPDEVRRLSKEILRDPVNVEVAPRRSAPAHGVRQSLLPVAKERKRELMAHLVEKEARGQTLVFTRTKHGANKLARHLERRGHAVAVLHGNRSQTQRTKALDAFKKKRARVMVATDIAGRGIDVVGITHVVNYDLPNVPEDYVHRVGRTARAGATGDAISLMAPEDRQHVRAIEALIGRTIECRTVEGFTDGAMADRRDAVHSRPPRTPDPRNARRTGGDGGPDAGLRRPPPAVTGR